MTNKVLGASTTNGFLGVSPDWANISCPNGRTLQSILTSGTVQYWRVNATQQTGGELLASGNYANPVSVAGNSLDNANAIKAILVSQGLSGEYGYFADGFTLNNPLDVGIDSSYQFWKYTGAETLPYAVPQDTDPSAGDWELVKLNDHSRDINRNAVGAHDDIYTRTVTLAEAQAEDAPVDTRYIISDRDSFRFNVKSGLIPNGMDIIDAGNSKQLQIEIDSTSYCSLRAIGWSFGVDAGPLIYRAAEIGIKNLKLPKGTITSSQIDVDSNFQTMQIKGIGSGFAYTPQTAIVPATPEQTDIFVSQLELSGVDNVKFKGFFLNGQDTCEYGIRQLSGAGWEFEDIQTDNFNEWAIYGEQGLNYYNRLFVRSNRDTGTGGLAVYSDSFIDNLECTGGGIGLWLMAGGNRVSNVLSNGQSENCILIMPLTSSTNHINTALSNIYVGEVYNPIVGKSLIKIINNGASRPRDVQFSNLHTVSAAASGVKHNIHVEIEGSDRITFNGWQGFGIGDFETNDLYDAGGIKITNSTQVKLASGCLTDISQAPIEVINSSVTICDGFTPQNWGSNIITNPIRQAGVLCNDSTSKIVIGNVEFRNARKSATKAGYFSDGSVATIGTLFCDLAGTAPEEMFTFLTKDAPYTARRNTFNYVQVFGRRITKFGEFASLAGGGLVSNAFSIPNLAADASYSLSIQQKGTGANATLGKAFANGVNSGIITIGNTNTVAALQNTFSISGLNVSVDIGTGYGATTWVYQYTREL